VRQNHWDSSNIMTIVLGCDPVSVLLPHGDSLYTCVGSRVMLLDTCGTVTKSLDVSSDDDHEQSISISSRQNIAISHLFTTQDVSTN